MTTKEIFFVICNNCGEQIPEEETVDSEVDGIICNNCADYFEEIDDSPFWLTDENEEEYWNHEDPD